MMERDVFPCVESSGESEWPGSNQRLPQHVGRQENMAAKMVLGSQRLCSLLVQSSSGELLTLTYKL